MKLSEAGFCVHDTRFVVNYYRMTPDHRLLFGGGENYRRSFPRDIKSLVRRVHAGRSFRNSMMFRIDFAWGWNTGDHNESVAAFWASRAERMVRAGIFRARPDADHACRQADCRGGIDGMADRFDAFYAYGATEISRWHAATLARHGCRDALLQSSRSKFSSRRTVICV